MEEKHILASSKENIFYLSGFTGSSGICLKVENKTYLFTDLRYKGRAEKEIKKNVEIIFYEKDFWEKWNKILLKEKVSEISYEDKFLPVKNWRLFKRKSNVSRFIPLGDYFENLRAVKTAEEIKLIKKACNITDDLFFALKNFFKKGLSELEAKIFIEDFFRKNDSEPAFDPIVAFGENSSSPHHKSGSRKLKANEIILVDCGAKYKNYCSDMTRIFCIGSVFPEIEKNYKKLLDVQKKAITDLEEFKSPKKIEDLARKRLGNISRNFTHSLGHGLGICIHELPFISQKNKKSLKINSTFTIEPGIYFQGKYGLRIEDTLLLKRSGAEILTKFPKEEIIRF